MIVPIFVVPLISASTILSTTKLGCTSNTNQARQSQVLQVISLHLYYTKPGCTSNRSQALLS